MRYKVFVKEIFHLRFRNAPLTLCVRPLSRSLAHERTLTGLNMVLDFSDIVDILTGTDEFEFFLFERPRIQWKFYNIEYKPSITLKNYAFVQ
jgi:hypothetical protein